MRHVILSIALLALAAPTVAFAQSANADAGIEADARIRAALDHALEAGVPVELLESKIAEGRAKGVDRARIAAAVENRARVLARVRAALQAGEPPGRTPPGRTLDGEALGELVAAADAHERGVSLEAITRLTARAEGDRSAALIVLADLVASGRASEHALATVEAAMARGRGGLNELGASADARAGARARAGAAGVDARVGAGVDVGVRTAAPTRRGGGI